MSKDYLANLGNFFDDDFFKCGFGLPISIRYNTAGTKDMMPAVWRDYFDENGNKIGYKAICRTVGVDESDVKIEIKENSLIVSGKTEYEGSIYSQYVELPIVEDVMSNIEKVDYKTKNGLTYIYLKVKKTEKKNFTINKKIGRASCRERV